MSKSKSLNVTVPPRNYKFEGFNNTKRAVHRNGKQRKW